MKEEKKAWALIEQGYDPSFTGEAYGTFLHLSDLLPGPNGGAGYDVMHTNAEELADLERHLAAHRDQGEPDPPEQDAEPLAHPPGEDAHQPAEEVQDPVPPGTILEVNGQVPLAILPVLVLYLVFSRQLIRGITAGAVK